ncbi:universal stress protein [Mameliella sp. CS4]|uniref:universal stress protein n=1 Tax=Mameliella sp. CS4 TaxID=2862329 RepID=UPI001C5CCAC1|nr:universal stress protein [Mameliella sp. CS4]MBW4980994.1 universal stress protein [Mameliella sp. CS4]
MNDKFVVGFDGSEAARRALDFAMDRATAQGATVVIAHVLEWSPYSFLTPTELEERHMRRKEELNRAETSIITPAKASVEGKGVPVETVLRYGHIADTLCEVAEKMEATQIFIGRNGHSRFGSRVFGSVAGNLVQTAPVPCTIVP